MHKDTDGKDDNGKKEERKGYRVRTRVKSEGEVRIEEKRDHA